MIGTVQSRTVNGGSIPDIPGDDNNLLELEEIQKEIQRAETPLSPPEINLPAGINLSDNLQAKLEAFDEKHGTQFAPVFMSFTGTHASIAIEDVFRARRAYGEDLRPETLAAVLEGAMIGKSAIAELYQVWQAEELAPYRTTAREAPVVELNETVLRGIVLKHALPQEWRHLIEQMKKREAS